MKQIVIAAALVALLAPAVSAEEPKKPVRPPGNAATEAMNKVTPTVKPPAGTATPETAVTPPDYETSTDQINKVVPDMKPDGSTK